MATTYSIPIANNISEKTITDTNKQQNMTFKVISENKSNNSNGYT